MRKSEFSISRNYCDIEELYSLERVQTIGVTTNWELNTRLNRNQRGTQPLDKLDWSVDERTEYELNTLI